MAALSDFDWLAEPTSQEEKARDALDQLEKQGLFGAKPTRMHPVCQNGNRFQAVYNTDTGTFRVYQIVGLGNGHPNPDEQSVLSTFAEDTIDGRWAYDSSTRSLVRIRVGVES